LSTAAPLRNTPAKPRQSSHLGHRGVLLLRKCACGSPTSSLTGKCEECRNSTGLQAKLTIGASDDWMEREADRVADQIMAAPLDFAVSGVSPHIQRFAGKLSGQADTAPASVDSVLAGTGRPLDPALRQDMEQRFGHDFSRVRVHSGGAAEQSARDVNANAYTVGHNIVFGTGRFAPVSHEGRRLIAHELTPVVQQSGADRKFEETEKIGPSSIQAPLVADGTALKLRAQPDKKPPPKKQKSKIPQICDRASRKVPGNSITKVELDVGAGTLTIEWQDQTKIPPLSGGTHRISPGAGLCCVDCNDDKVSQTKDTLCTPKGGAWPVVPTDKCALSGHPTAKNPTYFQRAGVAIHSGNTSNPPQSHGCARTSLEISELIYDNAVPGQTQIASSGTWAGKTCYLAEKSKKLSNRSDVCDGNKLKSKDKDKKTKKKRSQINIPAAPEGIPTEYALERAQPTMPVTAVFAAQSDELATAEELEPGVEGQSEMIADGPGPNNEPLSHESIGEAPMAELDEVEETG
jgi:hypothetical protein